MRRVVTVLVILIPLALIAGILVWANSTTSLPDGPVDIVWDRQPCAFCAMHVGEPNYSAQLQTTDGDVLAFDDPGCLFALLDRDPPPVHAIYFHHMSEDRWIHSEKVAFRSVTPTPMGYDLGAVDAGSPDTVSLAAAHEQVRERHRQKDQDR